MKLALTPRATPPALITNLSSEQQACLDHLLTSSSNLCIIAGPGSGKTYTLEAICCFINHHFPSANIGVLAYSAKLKPELQHRFTKRGILRASINTVHGFGKQALEAHLGKSFKPNDWKTADLIKALPSNLHFADAKVLSRFISLAKDAGVGTHLLPNTIETLESLYTHHDLDHNTDRLSLRTFLNHAQNILLLSNDYKKIDLSDLIYLPILNNLPFPTFDFVIIDEAQDINATRREVAARMLSPTSRLIAVGDPHQAIFGFTGADAASLPNITSQFSCTTLPLTTCYRCSTSVVDRAKKIYSSIAPAPNAPAGSITTITEPAFHQRLRVENHATSAVLCRKNAPLVKLAVTLLRLDIPVRMEGTDIGANLIRLIDTFKAEDLKQLLTSLTLYRNKQAAKLSAWKFETLNDQLCCIEYFATGLRVSSVDQLKDKLKELFSNYDPTQQHKLTLSSIHKSKGLEWNTVFLLGPNAWMPSKFATKDWMKVQEKNLEWVAVTRAKLHLVEVEVIED